MKQLRDCVLIVVFFALGAQPFRSSMHQHESLVHVLFIISLLTTAGWFIAAAASRWLDMRRLAQYAGSANFGLAVGVYVALLY